MSEVRSNIEMTSLDAACDRISKLEGALNRMITWRESCFCFEGAAECMDCNLGSAIDKASVCAYHHAKRLMA